MPCYFLLTELCCYGKTYRIPFGLTHGGKREQCTTKSALIYKLLYLFEVFYLPLLLFDTGMEKILSKLPMNFAMKSESHTYCLILKVPLMRYWIFALTKMLKFGQILCLCSVFKFVRYTNFYLVNCRFIPWNTYLFTIRACT